MKISIQRLLICLFVSITGSAEADAQALSLEQAIELALDANQNILTAQYRAELAALDYESVQSRLKPQIRSFMSSDARSGAEIGRHYGLVLDKQLTSGGALAVGYYNSNFGENYLSEVRFSYKLPFFGGDGQRIRGELDDARFSKAHENNRLKVAAIELKRDVAHRYYDLVLANDQLQLAEQLVKTAGEREEASRIRLEGEQLSQLDLRKTSIALIKTRQRLASAREQQIVAESYLKLAIGAPAESNIVVEDHVTSSTGWTLADQPLDELCIRAERNRLDLSLARHELQRLSQRLQQEKKTLLPNVEVSLQYSLVSQAENFGNSHSFDEGRFGIGLKMNTDLTRSGRNNQQQRRYLEFTNLRREYQRSVDLVKMDIQQAQAGVLTHRDDLTLARELTALAEEEQQRGSLMAEGGFIDSLTLFDLDQRVDEARHQERASKIALIRADYELLLATGEPL